MPRSRSRSRSYDRKRRSRSRDHDRRHMRPYESRDDYRPYKKRDRSRERGERSHRDHDRDKRRHDEYSRKRHRSSRTKSRSRSKGHSRSSHSHSSSRDKKARDKNDDRKTSNQSSDNDTKKEFDIAEHQESNDTNQNIPDIEMPFSGDLKDELYRKSFQSFSNENKLIMTNIESEEDRIAIQLKMQEHLKRHFAAQGKVYPPPKPEKPLINAATGFANDGSFLEQFKKMQNDYKEKMEQEERNKRNEERLKGLPLRRRGGKILKTGIVAKNKISEENQETPVDAWSLYLKEVQKYKNASCDADSKTRPLVK